MFDVTVMVYGEAAHTSGQTDDSPSSFYREDALLALTICKFTVLSMCTF